jgi:hypothetical protein
MGGARDPQRRRSHLLGRLLTLLGDPSALDKPETIESPTDREVATFARKVTIDPALASGDDFARLRKLFDDKKVAEIVYQITEAASFDRLTEVAGLRLED